MCSYAALVAGSVGALYRRLRQKKDWMQFTVWLGVAGLAVHELVEFSLYIPALAWPCFLFAGWLWGLRMNQFDKPSSPSYAPTPKK